MTKERMKDLLIIGMLPFVIVAYKTTDWSFMESSEARECVIIHESAPAHLRCQETYEQPRCPYFHACSP